MKLMIPSIANVGIQTDAEGAEKISILNISHNIIEYKNFEDYFNHCCRIALPKPNLQEMSRPQFVFGEQQQDFLSASDISRINARKLKRCLEELNVCWKTGCYNACALLMRTIINSVIEQRFRSYGKYIEIKNADLSKRLERFKQQDVGRNVKRASEILQQTIKLLGDEAAHGNSLVNKEDIANCQAAFKIFLSTVLNEPEKATVSLERK